MIDFSDTTQGTEYTLGFPNERPMHIIITPDMLPEENLTHPIKLQVIERNDETWVYWDEIEEYGVGKDLDAAIKNLFFLTDAYKHLYKVKAGPSSKYWQEHEKKLHDAFV